MESLWPPQSHAYRLRIQNDVAQNKSCVLCQSASPASGAAVISAKAACKPFSNAPFDNVADVVTMRPCTQGECRAASYKFSTVSSAPPSHKATEGRGKASPSAPPSSRLRTGRQGFGGTQSADRSRDAKGVQDRQLFADFPRFWIHFEYL